MAHELLERDGALQALATHASKAGAGRGSLVLVSGEAGIGKTSLVERFAQSRPDVRLLVGYGEETDTVRPLGVFHDLALVLPGALRACLAESPPHWRIHEALIDDVSGLDPLPMVCIEDAQWADQASLQTLRYVARRCARHRLLVVATMRIDDPRAQRARESMLAGLPLDAWDEIRLERLSLAAVRRLAGDRGPDAATLHRLTRGNPLFLQSHLRWGGAGAPESLGRLALQKLAALSPQGADLVRRLSILAERIPDATLRRLPGATDACIAECARQHWIAERDGHWSFEHELLRREVLDTLDPDRRARFHADLLALPLTDVQAVHHALHAGDAARLRALAPRAAEASERAGAFREAAEYWRIALAHAAPDARERARWLDRMAWSLVHADEVDSGLRAMREARREWLALGDADGTLHNMASALRWPLRVRAALDLFDEDALAAALESTAPAGRGFDRLIVTVELALRAAARGDLRRVRELSRAARDGAGALSSEAERAEIRWWIAWLGFYFLGEAPDADLDEAVAIGERLGLEHFVPQAHALQALAAALRFDLDQAERRCRAAIERCEQRDQSQALALLQGFLAFVLMRRGRFGESVAILERLRTSLRPSAPGADFLLAVSWTLSARMGRPDPDVTWDLALDRPRRAGNVAALAAMLTHAAEHRWLEGRDDRAREHLRELHALRARLAGERALPLAQTVDWLAALLGEPAAPGGPTAPGRPDAPSGPGVDAIGPPKASARFWQRHGMPYQAAMELARGDDASRRQAVATIEALGAAGAMARLDAHWRRGGATAVPRGPRAATRANPAGLTPRERQVLGVLARGLANAQIADELGLSTRTVEHHLAAILSKTGTRSRLEAVAWARRNALV